MLCDAVREEEIYEAYLLYASLHGYRTDETHVRARIASYLNNVPDSIIDEALLAYAEDRIVAPPDVVLPRWGRSRIYELIQTPQREWRHQVCESWFENNCEFYNDFRDPALYHFWTLLRPPAENPAQPPPTCVGMRLRFELVEQSVRVFHRQLGLVGDLPGLLSHEIVRRAHCQLRYLVLVDAASAVDVEVGPDREPQFGCRLLVTVATPSVSLGPVIAYARQAFQAKRAKC